MSFDVEFLGAAGEVTGSLYRLRTPEGIALLECGLVQGGRKAEARNAEPFPFEVGAIDAVVLSHVHLSAFRGIPCGETVDVLPDLRARFHDAGHMHHRLRNNVSRPECHLVIVRFQALGGRLRRDLEAPVTVAGPGLAISV